MIPSLRALLIDPRDTVAVALTFIPKSKPLQVVAEGRPVMDLTSTEDISLGHKLSIKEISPGDLVIKYGEVIGRATRRIAPGAHVHVHNLQSLRGKQTHFENQDL
jgi:altronate dehydratase small subunit